MKRFSLTKFLIAAILVVCSTMSFNGWASAASSTGGKQSANVYGINYTYYASIHNNTSDTWARGHVTFPYGSGVQAGYVAINTKLYNNSASVVNSTGVQYLPDASAGTTGYVVDGAKYSTKGTYFAKADVHLYNGNGYNLYTTYQSPKLSRALPIIPNEPFKVNENNLTYGSDYYVSSTEEGPDLIQAVGKNGTEGYVYSKDINLDFNSLSDVLTYMNSGQSNFTVPLYAVDGVTIIDSFEVGVE